MTREEAYKLKLIDLGKKGIIDKIYNDFESRACKSCKFNKEIEWCEVYDIDNSQIDRGCGLWEAIDD